MHRQIPAEQIEHHLGDRITLQGDIFPMTAELTLRGIFGLAGKQRNSVFPRTYLEESFPAV